MKLLCLIGDHPRNIHIARQLAGLDIDIELVVEERSPLVPEIQAPLSDFEASLFNLHFEKRKAAESAHFGKHDFYLDLIRPRLRIPSGRLNEGSLASFVRGKNFAGTFCFGISFIRDRLLRELPAPVVNLHSGLTPYFMGDASNFWASYFLQPNHAGATFHYVDDGIDTGPIVHQVRPILEPGDGLHDVASKAIIQAGHELQTVIENVYRGNQVVGAVKAGGRHFYKRDFRPAHLDVMYNYLGDGVADLYLDGAIRAPEPNLVVIS